MSKDREGAERRLVVVAEAGSSVEAWGRVADEEREQLLVICQELGEDPARFAERAAERVNRLQRSDLPPSRAVLALHAAPEHRTLRSRRRMALALLQALPRRAGELVISAPRVLSKEGDRQLWALLDGLTRSSAAAGIGIRLQFQAPPVDAEPESSQFRLVAAAPVAADASEPALLCS